ncbi:MAG: hypothetical protein ACE5IH_00205 [Thermodesulfobacteriota bacterium]
MKRLTLFFVSIFIIALFMGNSGILLANVGRSRVAILPFENLTNFPRANYILLDYLHQELDNRFFVVPQDEVENFLASRRIRYTGGINRLDARMMKKSIDVDAVLVGSADLFVEGAGDIYVGLTLRLVSTIDGSILWADTVSYAGEDFTTILGLGRVTNLEELRTRVIKEIVGRLTREDVVKRLAGVSQDVSPFELEKIVVDPPIGRQGEKVEISVKVMSIADEPVEVKGAWNGTEIKFRKFKEGEYKGSTVFSKEEGVHHLNIFVKDKGMNIVPFYSAAKVVVDNTPPVVKLAVDNKVFSPKRKGYTTFSPDIESFDEIRVWVMEILNEKGEKVRGDRGYDRLPKMLIWKGENDARMWVEDGLYTYRFTVKDTAGNEVVISDVIRIKSKPPQIDVDIDVVENRLIFLLDSGNEEVKSWGITLMDKEGKEVKVIEGKDSVPPTVDYLLNRGDKLDNLSFSFTATDEAGNVFNTSSSIPSILFKKSPFTNIPFTKRINGNGFMIGDF